MEIRDSATRNKYIEAKKFVEEYEKAYSIAARVKDQTTMELYKLREQITYMRKRNSPIYAGLILSRLKIIKEILISKFKK